MPDEITVKTAVKPKTAAGKSAAKKAAKPAVAKKAVAKKAVTKKAVAKKAVAKKSVAKPAVKATRAAAKPAAKKPAVKSVGKTAAKPVSKEKVKKSKLIRDSFTMPEAEYQVLSDVKKAFLKLGVSVKKSELLRASVALIKNMDTNHLNAVISALSPIKAGRPKKDK
jgi:hypothetical protein